MPKQMLVTPTMAEKIGKTCHRFGIPVSYAIPKINQVTNLPDPKQVPDIQAQMAVVPCTKEACIKWNKEKNQCWEVLADKAQTDMQFTACRLLEVLQAIEGLMRVSQGDH